MSRSDSVIHNIGYRHYDGPRLGTRDIVKALFSQTLRGSYGIDRGPIAKLFPWFLTGFMLLPAVIMVAIGNAAKTPVMDIPSYMVYVQVVPCLFLAVQAPHAVSRDLRFGVTPLYFSRPITARDYVHARFAGIWAGLYLLLAVPVLLLYAGELLIDQPLMASTLDLGAGLFGAAVLAALFTSIGMLIGSVTPRRGLGIAAITAALFGSYGAASLLANLGIAVQNEPVAHLAAMLSPVSLAESVTGFVLRAPLTLEGTRPDTVEGVVLCLWAIGLLAMSYWLLTIRYRKVSSR